MPNFPKVRKKVRTTKARGGAHHLSAARRRTRRPCGGAAYGRKPDGFWRYATADDESAFYAGRWNEPDDKKTFRPASYCEGEGWRFCAWPDHRPPYRLPELAADEKAPVVICEGEKAADAAAAIFPQSIVTTSSGGAGAAVKTDWTPLAGRRVLIWPDNDAAGRKYAEQVAHILAALNCSVLLSDAKGLAALDPNGGARDPVEKWDAADAAGEWTDHGMSEKLRTISPSLSIRARFLCPMIRLKCRRRACGRSGKRRGETKTNRKIWIAAAFESWLLPRCAWARVGQVFALADPDGRTHNRHVTDSALQGDPAALSPALASDGLRINRTRQRDFAGYLSGAASSRG